jgi:hypothetical protein
MWINFGVFKCKNKCYTFYVTSAHSQVMAFPTAGVSKQYNFHEVRICTSFLLWFEGLTSDNFVQHKINSWTTYTVRKRHERSSGWQLRHVLLPRSLVIETESIPEKSVGLNYLTLLSAWDDFTEFSPYKILNFKFGKL